MTKRAQDVTRSDVVLIAEDDEAVRNAICRTLRSAGYAAVEARDGRDALAQLKKNLTIALLIADLQLPYVKGDEVARQARLTRPDLKVLYVSGLLDQLFETRSQRWQKEAFLEKPLTRQHLLSAVRLLLRARGDALSESAPGDIW